MADTPNGGANDATSGASSSNRRRRRGTRGGRNRRKRTDHQGSTEVAKRPDDLPDRPSEGIPTPALDTAPRASRAPKSDDSSRDARSGGQGRRGRGRGRSRQTDREDVRKGRERKGKAVGRYFMCVHVHEKATQIAVLEGRTLVEHYVSRPQDDVTQIFGSIYLGRVQNVLPGMEAAFVDIGTPKNAVLYRSDVQYDHEEIEGSEQPSTVRRIEQMLRPNQTLICQVTKNPIGTKGARLTQDVSLPGRFVVLVPNQPNTYGISKRLPDDERRRLRRVLDEVKPDGHGLIVRTAAEGVSEDELQRDVKRLSLQWEEIEKRVKREKAPALLYREPDMAVRMIREEFNRDYRGVVIDDEDLFEQVHSYVASISPDMADRVEYYDPEEEQLSLYERYHVHEQVHKGIDRKVWLPSGGSLIIERTEALTVIDVNTGKNVGTSNLEETVYRNNLEAAEEIARQLRLRDIGGIIVIDFIDMEIARNRADVLRSFREALSRDKTRTQVFEISELGLVEMTRKRISEGLVESLSETCPTCMGRGFVFDEDLLGHSAIGEGAYERVETGRSLPDSDDDESDETSNHDHSALDAEGSTSVL